MSREGSQKSEMSYVPFERLEKLDLIGFIAPAQPAQHKYFGEDLVWKVLFIIDIILSLTLLDL